MITYRKGYCYKTEKGTVITVHSVTIHSDTSESVKGRTFTQAGGTWLFTSTSTDLESYGYYELGKVDDFPELFL